MPIGEGLRAALTAAGRGLLLVVLSLLVGLPVFVFAVVSLALTPAGVGLLLTPVAMSAVRGLAEGERRRARRWSGVEIATPYRPRPDTSLRVRLTLWRRLCADPATWRDLLWLFVNVAVGLVLGLLPACLLALCVEGLVAVPLLIVGAATAYAWVSLGLGVAAVLLAPFAGAAILKGHALFSAALLAPTRQALTARVGVLTDSRSQVLDSSAAQLRRIERDLHDGAQTRLAALGLSIGLAEQLVRDDPDAAMALLAEARESSGQALAELRDLVRGIHPPVLAERGLDGAIRALALALPMSVELNLDVPDDLPDPVESAVYFAVAEALANAAKHSGARALRLQVTHLPPLLTAEVCDDGRGGARVEPGGGLDGIRQRLAAFDGELTLHSPPGGPTTVTMVVPCASS